MSGADNPGKIQPGCLDNGLRYYLGIQPPLNDAEKLHAFQEAKYKPIQRLQGTNYDVLVYLGVELMRDAEDTDEAFMSFAGEMQEYLGERALADLKVIKSKRPHTA